jgi:hypothetical protein
MMMITKIVMLFDERFLPTRDRPSCHVINSEGRSGAGNQFQKQFGNSMEAQFGGRVV